MNKFTLISAAVFLSVALAGCGEQQIEQGNASLKFYLTDNPGEFQQVNIDLEAIRIILNDSIIDIPTISGVYNLLDFTNGLDTLVADALLPGGNLSQIRLVLGGNNTLMVDSVMHDLKTPSAQSSGLKLNVHQEILEGESYAFQLDFDAKRSVVSKGNGGFNLKPVIRVFSEVLTGSVHGVVSPPSADSLINLIMTGDTVSANADTLGNFMFRGLDPAMYDLEILGSGDFADTTISGIEVFAGETTELDTIFLE